MESNGGTDKDSKRERPDIPPEQERGRSFSLAKKAERRQGFSQGSITKILLSTVSFHAGDLLQQLPEMEPTL